MSEAAERNWLKSAARFSASPARISGSIGCSKPAQRRISACSSFCSTTLPNGA